MKMMAADVELRSEISLYLDGGNCCVEYETTHHTAPGTVIGFYHQKGTDTPPTYVLCAWRVRDNIPGNLTHTDSASIIGNLYYHNSTEPVKNYIGISLDELTEFHYAIWVRIESKIISANTSIVDVADSNCNYKFIKPTDIENNDTILVSDKISLMIVNVHEIEEGEVGDVPCLVIYGIFHTQNKHFRYTNGYKLKLDASVILLNRNE